jgi:hypothetical protein
MPETTQPEPKTAKSHPVERGRLRLGALRFSVAQFLVALVLLLVSAPFVEPMRFGKAIEASLFTAVLLSAVLAIGAGRRTLIWAILLVIPAVAGRWGNHIWPESISPEAGLIPALLFIVFVVLHLLRFILGAPRVNSEVLCAGIASYLMLGLLWAAAYVLVGRLVPNSFVFTAGPVAGQSMVGFNGLYFSFVTLSTVGYGDIVPVSPAARLLAIVEATAGMLYMTVLIARLVALYSASEPGEKKETTNEKDNQP